MCLASRPLILLELVARSTNAIIDYFPFYFRSGNGRPLNVLAPFPHSLLVKCYDLPDSFLGVGGENVEADLFQRKWLFLRSSRPSSMVDILVALSLH